MDNQQPAITSNTSSNLEKQYSFTGKQIVTFAIILIAIFLAVWVGKAVQIKSLKNEYHAREQALVQKSDYKIAETTRHFLKLIAKPYVWAVRKELMQGNINQVNLYGIDMVKEKNMVSVMVGNASGSIVSSTDKKYEGKNLLSIHSFVNLKADSAIVSKINDSLLMLTSPIMSFNSKLGTLVINYSSKPTNWLTKP